MNASENIKSEIGQAFLFSYHVQRVECVFRKEIDQNSQNYQTGDENFANLITSLKGQFQGGGETKKITG